MRAHRRQPVRLAVQFGLLSLLAGTGRCGWVEVRRGDLGLSLDFKGRGRSRRDGPIVAWHEMPGTAPPQKNRPVGHGVIRAGMRPDWMIGVIIFP